MVLKSCSVNEPLYYAKLVKFWKKKSVFKCWKYSGIKVWQSHFKKIMELMTSIIVILQLSFLLTFMQFFQIVIEKDKFIKKDLY